MFLFVEQSSKVTMRIDLEADLGEFCINLLDFGGVLYVLLFDEVLFVGGPMPKDWLVLLILLSTDWE